MNPKKLPKDALKSGQLSVITAVCRASSNVNTVNVLLIDKPVMMATGEVSMKNLERHFKPRE